MSRNPVPPIPSLVLALALAALAAGCGGSGSSDGARVAPARGAFDAERAFGDLRAQVELGPRPAGSAAGEREVRLIALGLRQAGIGGVRVQRPHRNVVARIPGDEPGAIVLGAHHDTFDVPGFLGANDGASGVALLLELARALPRRVEGPAIHLAFFDAEEARPGREFERDGMRGSRQYVEFARRGVQGAPPLGEIRAAVVFDMVGDCDLALPREGNSDPALHRELAAASEELTGDPGPFAGTRPPVLDDHVPFAEAGVPALDLVDFDYGPGPAPGAWWHTRADRLSRVCADSLEAVGEAMLRALPRIG